MSEKVKPYTREFYSKQIDCVLNEIKNDKEKLLDIIMDKCCEMEITIPISINEVQHYKVEYKKRADFRVP